MLAMVVNDDAPCLDDRVVWTFIASRLAPGIGGGISKYQVGFKAASLLLGNDQSFSCP